MATPRLLWTALLTATFAASGAWVLIGQGGSVTPSADPGAPSTHVSVFWLATLLLIAICWSSSRAVPWGQPESRAGIGGEVALLIGCAVVFPAAMRLPLEWRDADYVLVKVVTLLLIPAIGLWLLRRRRGASGVGWTTPRAGVLAIGGGLIGIGVYQYLTQFSPFAPARPTSWPPVELLVVAACVTALTAGIGEEIFYRWWLQTRLEAAMGRWPGILSASLLFAGMHLATHLTGNGLAADVASVIAVQGVFGIACGFLWSRYRRIWMPIVLHLLTNGLLVVVHLLGL